MLEGQVVLSCLLWGVAKPAPAPCDVPPRTALCCCPVCWELEPHVGSARRNSGAAVACALRHSLMLLLAPQKAQLAATLA